MGPGDRLSKRASSRWKRLLPALLALASAGGLASTPAAAQDTASAHVRVGMIGPASVLKISDMDFGRIAVFGTAGTVVLAPATSTCTVNGNLIRTGPCRAAQFSVRGRRNDIVRIREQNSGVVTLNGPNASTMMMTNFTISLKDLTPVNGGGNPSGNLGRYRIDQQSGIGEFRIGGTLNVGANQTPGLYRGTFVIQVVYN